MADALTCSICVSYSSRPQSVTPTRDNKRQSTYQSAAVEDSPATQLANSFADLSLSPTRLRSGDNRPQLEQRQTDQDMSTQGTEDQTLAAETSRSALETKNEVDRLTPVPSTIHKAMESDHNQEYVAKMLGFGR